MSKKRFYGIDFLRWKENIRSQRNNLLVNNGGIHFGMNYSVLNETKQNKMNSDHTKDFRLVNYSFNTGNIRSKIGQIVTDLWWTFQQLNK
jgi:hypothetical protein